MYVCNALLNALFVSLNPNVLLVKLLITCIKKVYLIIVFAATINSSTTLNV